MAAQVRAEGWGSAEVEADHLAMLAAPQEGTDVLLPIAQAAPFESSRLIGYGCSLLSRLRGAPVCGAVESLLYHIPAF